MVRFFGNQLTCKLGCGYCGRGGVLECCYSDESAIMALPRVSANLPPYNPSKSTLAFGDRTLPKINRELSSDDVEVVRQALLLLADLLHKPENITSACRGGLMRTLSILLQHIDGPVRYTSALCLQLAAEHALGREYFLDLNIISILSKLFTDKDMKVRLNSHKAVEMCSRTKQGAEGVVNAGLVATLVGRLLEEDDTELKSIILDTLHWCLQLSPDHGIQCNSINKLQPLLSHDSPTVRWRVARCIFDLTVPHTGKEMACDLKECVPSLVSLLTDSSSVTRSHSAAALMGIAVITRGKYAELTAGALPKLVSLLSNAASDVKLNALKAITLLAEIPEGKRELQDSLEKIETLHQDNLPSISKAAQIATKVITWIP